MVTPPEASKPTPVLSWSSHSWPPNLRDFCATLPGAYMHRATFQRWVDARKSLIINPVQISQATNQGVVGSNPASRTNFKDLGPQNQVLQVTVGPLRDRLSTGPPCLGDVMIQHRIAPPYPVWRTRA